MCFKKNGKQWDRNQSAFHCHQQKEDIGGLGVMSALADSDIQTMALLHRVAAFSFCALKLPLPDYTELHTWLEQSSLLGGQMEILQVNNKQLLKSTLHLFIYLLHLLGLFGQCK